MKFVNRYAKMAVALCSGLLSAVQASNDPAALPGFTRLTNSAISSLGGAQAITWGDYNNDGVPDVFFAVRSSSGSTLLLNDGHGNFSRAAGNVGANLVNPVGASWGDYDNDGREDLFIANNNGGNDSLLHNNGDLTFTTLKTGSIVGSAGNGNGCVWGDYDRDGFLDLYVANSDGNNFLFRAKGDGTFTRITSGSVVAGTGYSQGCTWIDYDNDRYPDLFVSRIQVPNLLYHNNRDGTFTKITNSPLVKENGTALGFCWGDYDNDGLPDLFVANGGTNNSLYHNDGNGNFSKQPSPIGKDSGNFQTVNWIDFDNDGRLDLFLTSVSAGTACRLYHNNADGTFTRVLGNPLVTDPGRWFAAAWADIDQDGFPDVALSSINNPNVIYRNNGNTNHWLKVHCLGRQSNRTGVGAKLRLKATILGQQFWQLREISTGGNIGSQDQLDPIFGLGDAVNVETLRVEWPSGVIQEVHNVPANQLLSLKEPATLLPVFKTGGSTVEAFLRSPANTVYEIESSNDLQNWSAWLTVTNNPGQSLFSDHITNKFRAYRALER
jgi:hypothetical protein